MRQCLIFKISFTQHNTERGILALSRSVQLRAWFKRRRSYPVSATELKQANGRLNRDKFRGSGHPFYRDKRRMITVKVSESTAGEGINCVIVQGH